MAVRVEKVSSKTSTSNGASSSTTPRKGDAKSSASQNGNDQAAPVLDDNLSLTPAEKKMVERVAPIYVMLGTGLGMWGGISSDAGLTGMGTRVTQLSEEAAKQWVILARTNSVVRDWLARIVEGVGLGGLLAVHAIMVMPLLAARGVIPAEVDAMASMFVPNAE